MAKGDFPELNWTEVLGVAIMSATVGVIRLLHAIRRGRRFKWFDAVLDPGMSVLGGMVVWALLEIGPTPDVIQAAFTSLGAWGGSRTLHWLEVKYLGGSRGTDFGTLENDREDRKG
jgi:hypothetical protein